MDQALENLPSLRKWKGLFLLEKRSKGSKKLKLLVTLTDSLSDIKLSRNILPNDFPE